MDHKKDKGEISFEEFSRWLRDNNYTARDYGWAKAHETFWFLIQVILLVLVFKYSLEYLVLWLKK